MLTPAVHTILAVDDELPYLRFLEALLTSEGYRVVLASDGARALETALERPPDLILLDLHLAAGLDGIAVCRTLKTDPATSRIPVICVTGMQDDHTRLSSLSSGANEYLAKPVDPAELLLRVRNTLRLRQAEELHARNEALLSHQATLEAKNRELEAALRELRRAVAARLGAEQQSELMRARVRRMELNELVGKVAVGVAHEVRNPLHAIMSLTDALCLKADNAADCAPFVAHIRAQVNRLGELMRELLEFGKPLDRERVRPVAASEICRDVAEQWRAHPAAASHPLQVEDTGADPGTVVLVDPLKLVQALLNLVENGADHSPEGAPLLLRACAGEEGSLLLEVVDGGAGIPAETLGRVFEPFFTTRRHGTGLGLCIVQRIAEDFGGRVELRPNRTGPGTSALLSLPAAPEATA